MACRLECSDALEIDDREVARHLYRIAEEAIGNAEKHSEATEIMVRLYATSKEVVLTVADNGRGYSEEQPSCGGLGLAIMKYRARAIGARLKIDTSVGQGTSVNCLLPN
jgi:signal transduction histidine kinase